MEGEGLGGQGPPLETEMIQFSQKVQALGDQAQRELAEPFARIDAVARENTRRVLSALTILELDRIVTQTSGKRFSLAVTLQ